MLVRLILVCLFVVSAAIAIAAEPISGDLVGLNVSLVAQKQLSVCDQLLAGEEWDAALEVIEKLQAEASGSLVQAEPGRYVGVSVAIQQRLCGLPAAGKEVYRRRTQSVTQSLWKRAREEQDDQALWRLADEFPASPRAAEATDRLASQAALRGDLELALRLWSRLRPAGDDQPPPAFRVEGPASIPGESRWLAARHLAGVSLSEEERQSLAGQPDSPWSRLLDEPQTVALTAPSDLRWSAHATENSPVTEHRRSLAVSTLGPMIVLNNGQQVRVLHAQNGQPYWPSGLPADAGEVYEDRQFDEKDSQRRELPCRIAGSVIAGDRYFGMVGDQPQWSARPDLVPRTTELFCLDLGTGQGRTVWRVDSSQLPEAQWQFHGAPSVAAGALPGDDLIVIPICRPEQQVELGLAAFRMDDGTLSWWTRIGTAAASPGQPLAETHVVVSGGLALVRTLTGVVAAINVRSGLTQWATTRIVASPVIQVGSSAPLIAARAGRVVIANPPLGQIMALSTDSGEVLWQAELADDLLAVTTAADRVLVSGRQLVALSLTDGLLEWKHGTGDPLDGGTGAAVVAGAVAVWPTRTGLWGVETISGRVRFHRALSASPLAVPMRVSVGAESILISLPDELAVFEVK